MKRCYLVPWNVLPANVGAGGGAPCRLVGGKLMTAPMMPGATCRWGWQGWPLDATLALVTIEWEARSAEYDQAGADWWEAQPGVVPLPERHEFYLPVPAAVATSLTAALQPVPATFGELAKTLPWLTRWELHR
jgi:hypothetical protein